MYPMTLNTLRSTAQEYGILHNYHRDPLDVDNDFYFRIGLPMPPGLSESTRRNVETRVRDSLSSGPPVLFDVNVSDLYVASYEDDTLPVGSTRVRSVPSIQGGGSPG